MLAAIKVKMNGSQKGKQKHMLNLFHKICN